MPSAARSNSFTYSSPALSGMAPNWRPSSESPPARCAATSTGCAASATRRARCLAPSAATDSAPASGCQPCCSATTRSSPSPLECVRRRYSESWRAEERLVIEPAGLVLDERLRSRAVRTDESRQRRGAGDATDFPIPATAEADLKRGVVLHRTRVQPCEIWIRFPAGSSKTEARGFQP